MTRRVCTKKAEARLRITVVYLLKPHVAGKADRNSFVIYYEY